MGLIAHTVMTSDQFRPVFPTNMKTFLRVRGRRRVCGTNTASKRFVEKRPDLQKNKPPWEQKRAAEISSRETGATPGFETRDPFLKPRLITYKQALKNHGAAWRDGYTLEIGQVLIDRPVLPQQPIRQVGVPPSACPGRRVHHCRDQDYLRWLRQHDARRAMAQTGAEEAGNRPQNPRTATG